MRLPLYIARRTGITPGKSFSRLIIRIGIIAIALSTAVMIVATSLVSGFKRTISEKMFDFWGHIQITHNNSNEDFEVYPLTYDTGMTRYLRNLKQAQYKDDAHFLFFTWEKTFTTRGGIRHVQPYCNKEGVIKSKQQIEGIVLRGMSAEFDWKTMRKFLIAGDTLNFNGPNPTDSVIISEVTSRRLEVTLGDKFNVYFVKNGQQLIRRFTVGGIYKTGLEEYDKRYCIADIRHIQQLDNYRPYRFYTQIAMPLDSVFTGRPAPDMGYEEEDLTILPVYPSDSMQISKVKTGSYIDPMGTDTAVVVLPENMANRLGAKVGDMLEFHLPDDDMVWVNKVRLIGICTSNPDNPVYMHWRHINAMNTLLPPAIAGYELYLDDIRDMTGIDRNIYYNVLPPWQRSITVKDAFPDIFSWLDLQDINTTIILTLMIIISVINMITSLLILILDRTNMIGILKALGLSNWRIRQVFLWNAAYITGYGLVIGNIIGLGFCFAQKLFGFIRLPEDLYYVSEAPVHIDFMTILLINAGTLFITLVALILPSWFVTRISPLRAIRFR